MAISPPPPKKEEERGTDAREARALSCGVERMTRGEGGVRFWRGGSECSLDDCVQHVLQG